MRDPRREPVRVGWSVSYFNRKRKGKGKDVEKNQEEGDEMLKPTPISSLLFFPGFLLPLLWFVGAFLPLPSFPSPTGTEKRDEKESRRRYIYNLVYKTWRDRCRFMALLSLVTYVPLVVLLAVFIPKS